MRLHANGDAMIGRETRMLLRHYLAQGASKSALARQLGISRDTIHRWIRDGDLDRDLEAAPTRPVLESTAASVSTIDFTRPRNSGGLQASARPGATAKTQNTPSTDQEMCLLFTMVHLP